jgi:hypothetical protein
MKIRLLTRAFVNGSIVNAGEVVDWPDDVPKPMRAVHKRHDSIIHDANHDHVHLGGDIEDEPLWEKYEEPKKEKRHG